MPASVERARSVARGLGMAALTLSMLGAVTLHQRLAGPAAQRQVFQRWMKTWADLQLRVFGVSSSVHGVLPPTAAGARLVVANHRSPIDILLLLKLFGGVVLSRGDLARWPLLGLAARRAETIFVDRDDAMSGVLAVRALRNRLGNGNTVIVFPEGTTLAGDEVRPFQQGAFAAARGLSVEIVPVGIAYPAGSEFLDESFMEHVSRMARRPVTHVACAVGSARPMPGHRKGLAEGLREEVQTLVNQARSELEHRRST
jgi:1-acyl-sn-glycerol-3-phosphate acyltransferase